MSNNPRFLPPEGRMSIQLANTDGHSFVIDAINPEDGKPGTEVPLRFRKMAIAEGCGIVGIDTGDGQDNTSDTEKTDLIIKAIAAVMERQAPEELNGDGRPTIAALKKQAGFGVNKGQFEAAWPLYVESLDDDQGE